MEGEGPAYLGRSAVPAAGVRFASREGGFCG